jgi:aspartyl protease family protein
LLDKLGYRREAADALDRFVRNCGAPLYALNQSASIYLKLTDYTKAVEVADEYVRRAPSDSNARYLRAVALDGTGDFQRALADYSDAIELYGADKKGVSSRVFLRMAGAYAALKRFCEATAPINMWVSLDLASRDTSRSQKIISDYEAQGNCASSKEFQKESFPLRGQRNVVTVKADINGVRGLFVIDTGASYVSLKSSFADRAGIPRPAPARSR